MNKKLVPSLKPQQLPKNDCWYYEEKSNIQIYSKKVQNEMVCKISKSMLIKSLSRMTGVDIKDLLKGNE